MGTIFKLKSLLYKFKIRVLKILDSILNYLHIIAKSIWKLTSFYFQKLWHILKKYYADILLGIVQGLSIYEIIFKAFPNTVKSQNLRNDLILYISISSIIYIVWDHIQIKRRYNPKILQNISLSAILFLAIVSSYYCFYLPITRVNTSSYLSMSDCKKLLIIPDTTKYLCGSFSNDSFFKSKELIQTSNPPTIKEFRIGIAPTFGAKYIKSIENSFENFITNYELFQVDYMKGQPEINTFEFGKYFLKKNTEFSLLVIKETEESILRMVIIPRESYTLTRINNDTITKKFEDLVILNLPSIDRLNEEKSDLKIQGITHAIAAFIFFEAGNFFESLKHTDLAITSLSNSEMCNKQDLISLIGLRAELIYSINPLESVPSLLLLNKLNPDNLFAAKSICELNCFFLESGRIKYGNSMDYFKNNFSEYYRRALKFRSKTLNLKDSVSGFANKVIDELSDTFN